MTRGQTREGCGQRSTTHGGSPGPAPPRSEAPRCLQRRFSPAPFTSSCANIVANEAQEAAQPHRSLCWFYHPAAAPFCRHGAMPRASPAACGVAVGAARGVSVPRGRGAAGWEPPEHSQPQPCLSSARQTKKTEMTAGNQKEARRIVSAYL